MAQEKFTIEKGLRIEGANSTAGADLDLAGSGTPGVDNDIGSLFSNTSGELYIKTAAGASNWTRIADITDVTGLQWRSEKVHAVTDDASPGGGITNFSDDDGSLSTEVKYDLSSDSAHQDIQFAAAVDGATATGLANDATEYTMSVEVDGSAQAIIVVGSAAQTITDLVTEINADLTGVTATFDDTNDLIKIDHDTAGSEKTIKITDTDLVSTLTAGTSASLSVQNITLTSGDYVIFDADSTTAAVLYKVDTVTDGTSTTFTVTGATALSDNDAFVVKKYLPDAPDSQEIQALVVYDSSTTSMIKISDVNWNYADGISLAAGYAAAGGNITSSDTVQSAVAKLDDNQDDINSALGTSQGDTDFGTFSGSILTDNSTARANVQELETDVDDIQTLTGVSAESADLGTFSGDIITNSSTIKTALQELELDLDAVQSLSGVADEAADLGTFSGDIITNSSTIKTALQELELAVEAVSIDGENEAVTSIVTLDSILVDNVYAVSWLLHAVDEANDTVSAWEIFATHDGEAAADATDIDYSVFSKLKMSGGVAGATITIDLNGTGVTQTMRLRVNATNTTKFRVKQIPVIDVA